ncbi:Minor extracellular protease vpr [Paramyrothecium foliicola]|nr:Minor extracellular protease vpr [Paramyrothecium foliicola]
MKVLQLLPLAGGALAGSIHRRDDGTVVDSVDQTKQFIIEVKEGTNVDALAKKLDLNDDVKILKTFDSDVFKGLTIETDGLNLDTLTEVSGVEQAWPATFIELAPLEGTRELGQISDAANYSIHSWTGVDKAHAAGIRGQGVKVAVVDTGVDYNHPALGGGFGPGFKVSGGLAWPIKNGVPDEDPMDQRGHGTHVAGIIAGKTDWFTGVAPDAEILAYKVFTSQSGTYDSFLIDAFIRAYEDGADIITSSIGSGGGWSNGPWATVASRIAEQGVVVTIAASNDGSQGAFYANSGSSGKEVLAIASAKAGTLAAKPFELISTINGKTTRVKTAYRYNYYPWEIKDWPIYPLFKDNTTDRQACTPQDIPANTPDLSDKIVLVRRGGCDILDQEFNLRANNVSYIMFYNNNSTRPDDPMSWLSGPKALVEKGVGENILDIIKAGGKVTTDFAKYKDVDWYVGIHNAVGNRPSEFTSWGGLYDMDLKPDVSAPGGEILSSWPNNAWRVASGTSMACPYAAGVAALYISKFGGRSVQGNQIARLFANRVKGSASAMPWSIVDSVTVVDTGFWAPTIQAGNGLLNAWKVLNYTSTLSTTKFNLNDTANFVGRQSVEITNKGTKEVTYKFSLQPAAGVEASAADGVGLAPLSQLQPIKMVPNVRFPSGTFKVKAGETKRAEFVFDYPRGLNATRQPLYSGKILIDSSIGEQLSVAYFGAAYSLKDQYKKLFIAGTPYIRSQGLDLSVKSKYVTYLTDEDSFTFDTRIDGPTKSDYPKIWASFIFGCDELRWDIYESGWTESRWSYPPVAGQNGYVGAATSFRDIQQYSWFDPAENDKENTIPFPIRALTRSVFVSPLIGYSTHSFFWLGKLANGTYIAPGTYKMRIAALRPLGSREKSADWEVWQTPEIKVLPLPN